MLKIKKKSKISKKKISWPRNPKWLFLLIFEVFHVFYV